LDALATTGFGKSKAANRNLFRLMFSCVNEVFVYFNSSIEEEKVRCQSLESKMSRVGSLPLSLTRTRLNSRSVSPLLLSSALSAETARLDFGTFGTRFCYIGTWNIRKTLPFLKVSIVLNSAGRLSLSLSLSPSASLKLEKKRLQNRASFLVLASLFRGTRARRTRWVLLFSRVFCSRGNFLCRPHPKEGQLRNARAREFAFMVVQQYYY
jgi:hypothetical protein